MKNLVAGNYIIQNNYISLEGESGRGIRVIGEYNKVYNNYISGISAVDAVVGIGTVFGPFGALYLSNGSPLHRTMIDSEVINNTFVNCNINFSVGLGAPESTTIIESAIIANNLVYTNSQDEDALLMIQLEPKDVKYESNMYFNTTREENVPEGFIFMDPGLVLDNETGLYLPTANSTTINSAANSYENIKDDIHGNIRDDKHDIGAFEYSENMNNTGPLSPEDVGPGAAQFEY